MAVRNCTNPETGIHLTFRLDDSRDLVGNFCRLSVALPEDISLGLHVSNGRRTTMFTKLAALAAAAWLFTSPLQAREVAVFDMAFINFSQEVDFGAKNEAEHARIRMLNAYLRDLLAGSGEFELVDTTALGEELTRYGDVFTCNHCEEKLARAAGAPASITGAVQKLSVLVQTIILRERDASTGEVVRLYQTDIRGNTDEAWRRGLKWLVEHRLLAEAGQPSRN